MCGISPVMGSVCVWGGGSDMTLSRDSWGCLAFTLSQRILVGPSGCSRGVKESCVVVVVVVEEPRQDSVLLNVTVGRVS